MGHAPADVPHSVGLWLGRAGLQADGDQPCGGIAGVGDVEPGGLEMGSWIMSRVERVLGESGQGQQPQNHRMVEFARDLWRSSCFTCCSSRFTYSRLPCTMSRQLLRISRISNLSQYSVTLRVKEVLPYLLCFSLCL